MVKDVDGTLHKVVASKSEADKFVNDTILMLDDERARIKQAAHEDIDRCLCARLPGSEQGINAYADWFFEWKRSYVVLKESITSAITRFFEAGKYELLTEAIEADVKDYFLGLQGAGAEARGARPRHQSRRRAGGSPRP